MVFRSSLIGRPTYILLDYCFQSKYLCNCICAVSRHSGIYRDYNKSNGVHKWKRFDHLFQYGMKLLTKS